MYANTIYISRFHSKPIHTEPDSIYLFHSLSNQYFYFDTSDFGCMCVCLDVKQARDNGRLSYCSHFKRLEREEAIRLNPRPIVIYILLDILFSRRISRFAGLSLHLHLQCTRGSSSPCNVRGLYINALSDSHATRVLKLEFFILVQGVILS